MKQYVENMKKYVENMKKCGEICGKYEEITNNLSTPDDDWLVQSKPGRVYV